MSGLFSLDKVKISYGKNEIVHGVSMDIAKGEFCALLGLNGSGKTTILHAWQIPSVRDSTRKSGPGLYHLYLRFAACREDAPPSMWC